MRNFERTIETTAAEEAVIGHSRLEYELASYPWSPADGKQAVRINFHKHISKDKRLFIN